MKGLMKMFFGGSPNWRGCRMIGLLRVYVGECAVVALSVGRGREIDTVKDCLRKTWMSDS